MAVENTPVAAWKKEALTVIVALQKQISESGRRVLLKQCGAVMLATTQRTFATSRDPWGKLWPSRYPSQEAPKFNVAGAIQDLLEGNRVKDRRFDDKPPLKDRGILARSFSSASKALAFPDTYTVECGTTVDYAAVHQWGGTSEIKVLTRDFKIKLAAFLMTKRGRTVRHHMAHLLKEKEYSQEILQRAFLGIPPEDALKFKDIIERAGKDAQDEALRKMKEPRPSRRPGTFSKISRWFKRWWK